MITRSCGDGSKEIAFISNKGAALLAAIDSGLIPKSDAGYNEEIFLRFWDSYEKILEERDHSIHVFQQQNSKWCNRGNNLPFAIILILEFVVLSLFFYFF